MGGDVALVTSLLVAFAGPQSDDDWAVCEDGDVREAMQWAGRLQPFLSLHPGSRQARGLRPQRAPVQLHMTEIPSEFLTGSSGSERGSPAPEQDLHGEVPAAQLDAAVVLDDSYSLPQPPQEEEPAGELEYLAGLHTPSPLGEPAFKQRAVEIELSCGSMDRPRVLRLPLSSEGELRLSLCIRTVSEPDPDGVETQLLPGVEPVVRPGVALPGCLSSAMVPPMVVDAPEPSSVVEVGVPGGSVVASTQLESRETDSGEGMLEPDGL